MARILYIDTDVNYGRVVSDHLKAAGHVCISDTRGDRALAVAQEQKVDMILCEVMLPDVCGFEICRRVRAHDALFMLPIVLISTMANEDEVRHGLSQGADDYLAKPVAPQALVTRVANQLNGVSAALQPDSVTDLSGPKVIRCTVQRAINAHKPFAVVYVEIVAIVPFARATSTDARDKVLQHGARLLKRYGKKTASDIFSVSHMGGGHFVCFLEPQYAEEFGQGVYQSWEKHLSELYTAVGAERLFNSGKNDVNAAQHPMLGITLCITDSAICGARCASEYFDVLEQMRKKALSTGKSGVFYDHRRSK